MSSIKKNIAYQTVYRVITIITPLITTPILARALGTDNLGVFSATLAFVNYFQLVSMLGVENYGNRTIAAAQGKLKEQQKLFWNIYAAQILSSSIAILLYAIALLFVSPNRFFVSLLQGLWLIGSVLNINWFFFGTEQFKLTVVRSIIIKILTVLLIVFLVHKPDDLPIYVVIMSGDTVLSNLLVWPFLRKNIRFEKPRWKLVRGHLKPIMILFVPILAMSVFHIMDKSMLDWLGTETDGGYYYSADKIINLPLSIVTALGTVMLPRVSNEYSKGNISGVKSMLAKSAELTIFMSCAVGIGIAAIAQEFVPLFFGPGYEACISLIYWFIPVLFAKAIGDLIRTQYMIPVHMDKCYTISVAVGAGVNLIANSILIIHLGALGAVIGTLIAEWTVTIIEVWYTRKQISFVLYVLKCWCYIVPAVFMILVVRVVATSINSSLLIKTLFSVLAGGAVYIGTCLLLWRHKNDTAFHEVSFIERIIMK